MYSTQAWAAHYGLPLNAPEDFVQGYADGMRLDAKGQGKPCGRGFIAPGKKCSAKGSRQLAADLKAGDAGAKARVATGKQNAMAQQAASARIRQGMGLEGVSEAPKPAPSTKRKRSPESIAKAKETRKRNREADAKAGGRLNRITNELQAKGKLKGL
jgi:hypothetical protein